MKCLCSSRMLVFLFPESVLMRFFSFAVLSVILQLTIAGAAPVCAQEALLPATPKRSTNAAPIASTKVVQRPIAVGTHIPRSDAPMQPRCRLDTVAVDQLFTDYGVDLVI